MTLTGLVTVSLSFVLPALVSWLVLSLAVVMLGGLVAVAAQATRSLHLRRHDVAKAYVVGQVELDERERDTMTWPESWSHFVRDLVLGSFMFVGAASMGRLVGRIDTLTPWHALWLQAGVLCGLVSAALLVSVLLSATLGRPIGHVPSRRQLLVARRGR